MDSNIGSLLQPICDLHVAIRSSVIKAFEETHDDVLSSVAADEEGDDTIYAVDRVSEETLVAYLEEHIASSVPIVLVAEGIEGGSVVLPRGTPEESAVWRIIVDPIDGTRGLMYQKRSAWILTGVAPNKGDATRLQDIELAVQTEIPLLKQYLSDELWAIRGRGAFAARYNRLTEERLPLHLQPSRADSIAHGFATISRFFPGGRDMLAAIDEEVMEAVLGPVRRGKAQLFEDQYISTGGQLYELMAGHDRFIADIRPLIDRALLESGRTPGICCHPYDLCTELIAREMGIIVTDEHGHAPNPPLDIHTDVTWIAYANEAIQAHIESHLQNALRRRGMIDHA